MGGGLSCLYRESRDERIERLGQPLRDKRRLLERERDDGERQMAQMRRSIRKQYHAGALTEARQHALAFALLERRYARVCEELRHFSVCLQHLRSEGAAGVLDAAVINLTASMGDRHRELGSEARKQLWATYSELRDAGVPASQQLMLLYDDDGAKDSGGGGGVAASRDAGQDAIAAEVFQRFGLGVAAPLVEVSPPPPAPPVPLQMDVEDDVSRELTRRLEQLVVMADNDHNGDDNNDNNHSSSSSSSMQSNALNMPGGGVSSSSSSSQSLPSKTAR